MKMINGLPRRAILFQMKPEEAGLLHLTKEIERIVADTRLTDAVVLLGQAREKLGDYFDEKE